MKRHLLFLFGLIISISLLADVPQGISHQAVMRDADNNLIAESPIGLQVSILQGAHDGNAVYVETHQVMTNQHGLITYVIGDGDVVYGVFQNIDWADGPYWLETKADPTGGENYSITGNTKFFSVPYSMYAEFAGHAETFSGLDALLARIEALEEALDNGVEDGTVTDIDGNVYQTVIIGNQEWMAENLRVTRYYNEDDIPTGLSNTEWSNTTDGAYAIYDHNQTWADGIDSPEEMVAAYGKLYNWYAVDDSRGLCPEGWSVPSHDDWTQLEQYMCNALGNSDCETHFPYDNTTIGWRGTNEGNALKSCRQVDSPLGGECNTSEHPRWHSHGTHYGFDEFGFSALPGGDRFSHGNYLSIGNYSGWWSSSEDSSSDAWSRYMLSPRGDVRRHLYNSRLGLSVRCFRNIE